MVQLAGTLSDPEIEAQRVRRCDFGMMRRLYKRADGRVGFRCPGEPEIQFLAKGGKPEEMVGKGCLCNSLLATAGLPQHRTDGYVEPPLVTAGDGLSGIQRFMSPGRHRYSARDVLDRLTGIPTLPA